MEHLDYATLDTLKDVMEDEFALLIETFIQDSSERIQTLKEVIGTYDGDLIRRAAHSFKGSSSNIGALQLAALCSVLEKKIIAGNFENLADDIDIIELEFIQVKLLLHNLV